MFDKEYSKMTKEEKEETDKIMNELDEIIGFDDDINEKNNTYSQISYEEYKRIFEKDKDGNCNPYVIRFIIKNGTEDNFKSRDDGIINTLLEEDNLILDFESFQKFVSFNKQENGSLRKNLEAKVRVKVEMNNGI